MSAEGGGAGTLRCDAQVSRVVRGHGKAAAAKHQSVVSLSAREMNGSETERQRFSRRIGWMISSMLARSKR